MTYATSSLAELAVLITKGTTPTTLGYDFATNGVPFLRAQNLQDGRVDVTADPLYISPQTHEALARSRIFSGDILISIAGTIGRTALVDEGLPEMNCNQAVAIVRPSSKIFPKYLLHWLSSSTAIDQIRKSEVTATISNLSLGQIGNISVALPPLEEQRRIAAILDQADDLRRKRWEALERVECLQNSIFFEMFGHPLVPRDGGEPITFENVTTRITYGFTSPMRHLDSGIPILTAKNIRDGYIDFDQVHYADQNEYNNLTSKSKPERGDILVTKDGTIGRCALVRVENPLCINQSVALVKPKATIVDPIYLLGYMLTAPVQSVFKSMGKGNAIAHLQITELAQLPVPLPPLDLQRAFAARVAAIDALKAQHRAHLAKLDALFASLQHRAFRGEL